MAGTLEKVCGGCALCSVITLIIFMFLSFGIVEITEYGLNYSRITRQVKNSVYSPGIHFIGLGHYFIKFPRTVVNLEFANEYNSDWTPLKSRTKDGLEIILDISFQYQLNNTQVRDLYFEFGQNWRMVIERTAIEHLTNEATQYNANEFFANRKKISSEMEENLSNYLVKDFFCKVIYFQLRQTQLPQEYEDSIIATEVVKQDIQKAKAELQQNMVLLETQTIQATYGASATINLAEGNASAIYFKSISDAFAISRIQTVTALQYKNMSTNLGITGATMLHMLRSTAVQDFKGSITVNLTNPEKVKSAKQATSKLYQQQSSNRILKRTKISAQEQKPVLKNNIAKKVTKQKVSRDKWTKPENKKMTQQNDTQLEVNELLEKLNEKDKLFKDVTKTKKVFKNEKSSQGILKSLEKF